jgi:hypothetical protein
MLGVHQRVQATRSSSRLTLDRWVCEMNMAPPMTEARFVRIHIQDVAYYTKRPKGLFAAIGNLVDGHVMTEGEVEEYWRNRRWFEANLPIPPFYKDLDPTPPVAKPLLPITWYKNNHLGNDMMSRMEFYFRMARKYGCQIYLTSTDSVPGEIVYEDDLQIGVIESKHEGPGFKTVPIDNAEHNSGRTQAGRGE